MGYRQAETLQTGLQACQAIREFLSDNLERLNNADAHWPNIKKFVSGYPKQKSALEITLKNLGTLEYGISAVMQKLVIEPLENEERDRGGRS